MNKHLYSDLLHDICVKHAARDCLHIKRDRQYKSWTYADFHRDLNKLSSVLMKGGLGKGANAAVIGDNSPEWVIAFHSILLTGACTVPIDPDLPATEIESIISATESRVVFCSPVFVPLFRSITKKSPAPFTIVVLSPDWSEAEPNFYRFIGDGNPANNAFGQIFDPDDPMVIIFTSGTTGKPKGAVLCQKNYTAVGNYAIARMKLGPDDTILSVLPLHHVFGFAASVAGPLLGGMDIVFVPELKGALILEALCDKKVTMLPAVPKMVCSFYDNIQLNVKKKGSLVRVLFAFLTLFSLTLGAIAGRKIRRTLFGSVHRLFGGKLRVIISGGAPLGKKYWNGFQTMGFNILEGYGLTETMGPITVCPFDDPRLRSVGPILPENEMKIIAPNVDGIGEVLLRGTCVFKGYFKRDDLTRKAFDADGWFMTGDLGRIDSSGFLYLSGRKKDVIVLDSGKNVYPDEIEDYYSLSLLIEEIGIFGIRQDDREIVAAAIVPIKEIRKNQSPAQAQQVLRKELDSMGKELPLYRRITDFIVLYHPLPRTSSKKIKKTDLAGIFTASKKNAADIPDTPDILSVPESELMRSVEFQNSVEGIVEVAERLKGRVITPRCCFKIDLGLDSLDQVALVNHLENRFSITIPDQEFDKTDTMADLVQLIKDLKAAQQ
jgi:long-chain acyl-CoA synthetase